MNNSDKGRLNVSASLRQRYLFILGGHLSVILGVLGLLLPLIPTSPFVILAAYCYARSSERFYLMLLNNKYFGKDIRRWEENRCINKRFKVFAVILLVAMFSSTILMFIESTKAYIATIILAMVLIGSILLIRSCPD